MRILLANTNTTQEVTDQIAREARKHAAPGVEIEAVTARFGAGIISTRSEAAISGHALLEICAERAGSMDAMIVGMSLDAGVWAARELLDVPVVGMSEAALHMASLFGNRLGLFVFGTVTQPYLEMAEAYGFGAKIGAIEALGVTPGEHLADPNRVERRIVDLIGKRAGDSVIDSAIIVGAVAVGLPERLREHLPVPAFEGISCAMALAQAMAALNPARPKAGTFVPPHARPSLGLGPGLASMLAAKRA